MGVTLDVYLNSGASFQHLNEKRQFWNAMVTRFNAKEISMQITTVDEVNFNRKGYPRNVRAHVRCSNDKETGELAPVKLAR